MDPASASAETSTASHGRLRSTIAAFPVTAAILLLLGGVFLVRFDGLSAVLSAGSTSPLSVDPPKFTCEAREGEIVTATFAVKNVGDRPLRVLGAESSCGCTIPKGLPLALDPGRSGNISLSVKVGRPNGNGGDADRRFTQDVRLLTSSDGVVPPLVFEATVISASVDHP